MNNAGETMVDGSESAWGVWVESAEIVGHWWRAGWPLSPVRTTRENAELIAAYRNSICIATFTAKPRSETH